MDVLVKFKAHGNYKGSVAAAVKIITKRFPGVEEKECKDLFERVCLMYDHAAAIISAGKYIDHTKNTTGYSESSDIDIKAFREELLSQESHVDAEIVSNLMQWIIFWYYLK